jgi:hypothetical protein
VPLAGWSSSPLLSIFKVVGTGTATSDGGAGIYPPGTIKFQPDNSTEQLSYCVARFVVPDDGAGNYVVETSAKAYLDSAISGDTDFHVLHNGSELFGTVVPGNGSTAYTNELALAAGDYVDFAVGPGADGSAFASGLKVTARLTTYCLPVTNLVIVTNVVTVTNTLSVAQLRQSLTAAGLETRTVRPIIASINSIEDRLIRADAQVQKRVAPVDADVAEELRAIIQALIGFSSE